MGSMQVLLISTLVFLTVSLQESQENVIEKSSPELTINPSSEAVAVGDNRKANAKGKEPRPRGFSAKDLSMIPAARPTTLKFRETTLNDGNYDKELGSYKAPSKGLYHFAFIVFADTPSAGDVEVAIFRGTKKTTIRAKTEIGPMSLAANGILHLNENDRVTCKLITGDLEVNDDNGNNVFYGFRFSKRKIMKK